MPQRRWQVAVRESDAAKALCDELGVPCELVERGDEVLAYAEFPDGQHAQHAPEALELAQKAVNRLNAVLSVAAPSRSALAAMGYVREISSDGRISGTTVLQGKGGVISLVAGSSGSAASGRRAIAVRAHELMQADANFAAALHLYSAAKEDFRMLYIVLEYVRDAASGGIGTPKQRWNALEAKGWALPADLTRFKDTAHDLYRHVPRPTANEMPLGEAVNLLRQMLRCWLVTALPQ